MAERPGFDWGRLTMGQKGTSIVAILLLLVQTAFTWNQAGECPFCVRLNGWSGLGTLAGLLALALLVWEGLNVFGALQTITMPTATVSAALAGATALFALLRALIPPSGGFGYSFGAWLGIILALAMGYAAYVRFQETKVAPPPPAAPPN